MPLRINENQRPHVNLLCKFTKIFQRLYNGGTLVQTRDGGLRIN